MEQYGAKDLEFSITKAAFDDLCADTFSGDTAALSDTTRDRIFALFSMNSAKNVSALDVVCGFATVCKGTAAEKAATMFKAYDFQNEGQISIEELHILFISAAKGILLMTGVGKDVRDTDLESYAEDCCAGAHSIDEAAFLAFLEKKAGRSLASADVPLALVLSKFALCTWENPESKTAAPAPAAEPAAAAGEEKPEAEPAAEPAATADGGGGDAAEAEAPAPEAAAVASSSSSAAAEPAETEGTSAES